MRQVPALRVLRIKTSTREAGSGVSIAEWLGRKTQRKREIGGRGPGTGHESEVGKKEKMTNNGPKKVKLPPGTPRIKRKISRSCRTTSTQSKGP